MKVFFRLVILTLLLVFAASAVYSYFLIKQTPPAKIRQFGVTYSKIFAEKLGLDWRKSYNNIFEDLGISLVRIPVYWQEVEKQEGVFDFSWLDWMMDKAEEHNAQIILVVGRKVPRWPECHEPDWIQNEKLAMKNEKLLGYIGETVRRYKNNPAVWAWQVENEPFLAFGECAILKVAQLDEEIALVRSLSDKPIIVTDSGEFGRWYKVYKRADIFGTTMYRHVYSKILGQITYPFPPWFFRLKKGIVEKYYGKKPSLVIELQAEPWGPRQIKNMTLEEQYMSMNPQKFKEMIEYASGSGFDTFYLWGVEWWYWLEGRGHTEMLDVVKEAVVSLNSK